MYHSLESALREVFGPEIKIKSRTRVFGGDINDSFCLTLEGGSSVFVKTNAARKIPMFEAEEAGLQVIAGTGKIGTAKVLGIGTDPGGFSFMLQEMIIPGRKIRDYWETLGAELCAMHRAPVLQEDCMECGNLNETCKESKEPEENERITGRLQVGKKRFGFPEDNFIGAGKQINSWHSAWIDFFRDCRLIPQLRLAERYLDKKDRASASFLLDHLEKYLVEPPAPSLLHGDLWGGNVMTGPDGKAWIIDPAVYYGHPEADLAMTELFGGFAPAFYSTYFDFADLTPGYKDRKDLYNLYHLLNHLNLFGAGYLSQVRQILRRYGS